MYNSYSGLVVQMGEIIVRTLLNANQINANIQNKYNKHKYKNINISSSLSAAA